MVVLVAVVDVIGVAIVVVLVGRRRVLVAVVGSTKLLLSSVALQVCTGYPQSNVTLPSCFSLKSRWLASS